MRLEVTALPLRYGEVSSDLGSSTPGISLILALDNLHACTITHETDLSRRSASSRTSLYISLGK